ncbi:CE1759 family FMN reductase [Mobiluncus porci]|uniref:Oxidoreductase n=1 Tax=Mobiluncus porci TaxID=2652278 RepID=A0A7K0K2T9_9ACTO|nr:CE1759 family FMN reductase [Mobiluncus porci]MST49370.1 oxidoreductase [Mobiluncus porci]
MQALEQTDPFQPRERHLVVVSGGTSEGSTSTMLAQDLAAATTDGLSALGIVPRVNVIELRSLASDAAAAATTLARTPELDEAVKSVESADGIIAVSPTYQASYSGIFKMFWDLVDPDLIKGVPFLLGATGGTARHSLVIDQAMGPLFSYLKALVAPTSVFAATEDWGDGDTNGLNDRIGRAGREFADLLAANEPRRQENTAGDSEPLTVTPFAQLLGNHD